MTSKTKLAVLGAGEFGTALAELSAKKNHMVMMWARTEELVYSINKHHRHPTRLSQFALAHNIVAEQSLQKVLEGAKLVVSALPMTALSSVLTAARDLLDKEAILISTSKGITKDSYALAHEVVAQALKASHAHRACFLSGPSFAIELMMGLPTALTLASRDKDSALLVQASFSHPQFRLYRTDDVVGACLGGALKNVIAIAAGAEVALSLGKNALAALITRGLAEMTRLATAMGGQAKTLSGLSGAGDLILSCSDNMSRNHRLGEYLAKGLSLSDALAKIGSVVEGAKTAHAIPHLVKKYQVEMPICSMVYRIVHEGLPIKQALDLLLSRGLKDEKA